MGKGKQYRTGNCTYGWGYSTVITVFVNVVNVYMTLITVSKTEYHNEDCNNCMYDRECGMYDC